MAACGLRRRLRGTVCLRLPLMQARGGSAMVAFARVIPLLIAVLAGMTLASADAHLYGDFARRLLSKGA